MSDHGILFVVSGPSGVGKSSISRKVIETVPDLRLSISCTTRSPRPGEEHGREYWFVNEGEFRRMIKQEAFAEWAEVYGYLYGTPWNELIEGRKQKHDIILDIDVQGARQVMHNLDDAISVFVMPPSLDILKSRLRGRGTDSPDIIERRFQQAQEEMQHYHEYDYTILNGSLENAAKEFASIVVAERTHTKRVDPAWLQQIGLLRTDELEQPTSTQ
jgi:guanylate kinase